MNPRPCPRCGEPTYWPPFGCGRAACGYLTPADQMAYWAPRLARVK